jgi:hypothetical protein
MSFRLRRGPPDLRFTVVGTTRGYQTHREFDPGPVLSIRADREIGSATLGRVLITRELACCRHLG